MSMNEIKCPHCGKVFQVDETGYANILRQVRDDIFEKEVEGNRAQFEREKKAELKIAKAEAEREKEKALSDAAEELHKALASKEKKIAELEAKLKAGESDKQLAIVTAVGEKEKEIAEQEKKIDSLRGKIELGKKESELELKSLTQQYEAQLRNKEEQYEAQLKIKNEQVEYYKDFKLRQSTKMLGESLEQHCEIEFNKLRATGFQNAYFEKDNDASSGTKGDYIYREETDDGIEVVSIMFEMKNEMDTTQTKHKNEDFLDKLDKDRKKKNCEYAVLVSLLEADNDLYNTGIVDMSHRYEKMYVVRPQFFIPIITILRNAAMNSLNARRALETARKQDIDVTNFEEKMKKFQEGFGKNYMAASKKFDEAIEEIDKSIAHLEKIKKALLSSENQLRLANDKAQDLSIKKLTRGNPTMKAKFDEVSKSSQEE